MKFYKDHYDVVIIGGALAGLSAALQLQQKGINDILILEKHNLPGGLATSYVRNGIEIEATLHEMMSIGSKEDRLKVGVFFDECGVDIDWLKVPEAYRFVEPKKGIDITLHSGFETMASEIDAQYPGWGPKVLEFMKLCNTVYDSMNILSVTPMSKPAMLMKHPEFVKTAGYTAMEVIDTWGFPQDIVDILSPYWIYVGNPLSTLPFTIYAFLMADYFRGGSYVPKKYSHEMSMKLQAKAEENGAQIEFCQEVEKILVKDGRVTGVRTKRGDTINCDYVISGAYPNKVYTQMIEPLSEVPDGAIKMVNGRRLSVTTASVMMVLDDTAENLGIKDYNLFSAGDTMDTDEMSMKLQAKAEENGAQIEFCQEVEKILVKDGKVTGVRTKRGDVINCDYVISGAYPNKVYTQMIEPLSEVPDGAIKMVNGRRLSVTTASVMMVLDDTAENLGIKDYNLFSAGDTMDTDEIWKQNQTTGPYKYLTSIALDLANPDATPAGMCQFSITNLPLVKGFLDLKEEDYYDFKRRMASEMIAEYERVSGVNIHDHIVEIEVSTPVTIAHYVGAWKGSIYGYSHSIDDHAVARLQMKEDDHFIDGLEFAGAHAISGNGMGPAVTNGRAAAKAVADDIYLKSQAKKMLEQMAAMSREAEGSKEE